MLKIAPVTLLGACLFACGGGGASHDSAPADAAAPAPDAAPAGEDAATADAVVVAPDGALPDAALPDAAPPPVPPPEVWGSPLLADENPDPNIFEATLVAGATHLTLDDGTELDALTYNGLNPGPRLDVRVGERVIIHFKNELDRPTTIHWHGLRISDQMDGNPRIQDPVQPGESFTYDFVPPDAGTYWYHPHVDASLQVERGLYAPIVVRGADEPVYDRERMFVIDDILLDGNQFPPFPADHMEEMHGRFGNRLLTNGQFNELTDDIPAGTVERWHFVNPANARTMYLGIEGAEWRVIGTDGGPVTPAYTPDRLIVSPGQRYDVEVRTGNDGPVQILSYVAELNAADQVVDVPYTLFTAPVTGEPADTPEWRYVAPEREVNRRADRQVSIDFDAHMDAEGHMVWTLNGMADMHEPMFTFHKGEVVDITLNNLQGPDHPFHLHGQFFEIFPGNFPEQQEPGRKDVVLVRGQNTVKIRARMDNPGEWMMHCHILAHAELGMMAMFMVEE